MAALGILCSGTAPNSLLFSKQDKTSELESVMRSSAQVYSSPPPSFLMVTVTGKLNILDTDWLNVGRPMLVTPVDSLPDKGISKGDAGPRSSRSSASRRL